MNNNEVLNPWKPISNLPDRVICEGVSDNYDGFRILLKEQCEPGIIKTVTRNIVITFDPTIAYRNIDESYRTRTFSKNSYRTGSFFVVDNSKFISWIKEESCGMYDDQPIKHYSIFTLNECIDILSEFDPVVEWVEIQ